MSAGTDVSDVAAEASDVADARRGEDQAALRAFLSPSSVAVVGASEDPGRVGGMPLRFLRQAGYTGKVFPINPGRETVQGEKSYPSLSAVNEPIDLAVIAVPADAVVAAVEECAVRGVRAAVVFSSGFAETDEAGRQRQTDLAEVARRTGIRICGPNCAGVMSVPHRLTASFGSHLAADIALPAGPISIVSQSGAVGAYMFTIARQRGVGLTHWVTTGNEVDVTVADFVELIAEDDETRVIAIYLEQVREVDTLVRACELARARGKRIVGVLAGRTQAAEVALRSHTASLAGDRDVAVAALEEIGIILVDSIDELLNVSIALSRSKQPQGNGLGVVTISGAAGIMTVDRAFEQGLATPALSPEAQNRMLSLLPYAGTANPVDVTGNISNRPEVFRPFLDELLEAPQIHGVVCFLGHVLLSPHVGERLLRDVIAAAGETEKPIWLVGVVADADAAADLDHAGVVLVDDPVAAVDLHAQCVRARGLPDAHISRRRSYQGVDVDVRSSECGLSEVAAQRLLAPTGVQFPKQGVVHSREAASTAADSMGTPTVVLKIVSPDIQHKSDVGGVRVDVPSAEAGFVYTELLEAVSERAPEARVEGVLVQEMVQGHPVIVGTKLDPDFGPVVLVGSGGIYTELLRDRALALAPVDRDAAERLLDRTSLPAFLGGARGGAPLARSELVDLVVRVSRFAWQARDQVATVELNPVMVSESSVTAADALIELRGAPHGV